MQRRKFLTNLKSNKPSGDKINKPSGGLREPVQGVPHVASPGPAVFTNALLRTHEDKEVRFYDDLIRGKHVLINMMYATCEGTCPLVTSNLVKVYESLKDRMGKRSVHVLDHRKTGRRRPGSAEKLCQNAPRAAAGLDLPDR